MVFSVLMDLGFSFLFRYRIVMVLLFDLVWLRVKFVIFMFRLFSVIFSVLIIFGMLWLWVYSICVLILVLILMLWIWMKCGLLLLKIVFVIECLCVLVIIVVLI